MSELKNFLYMCVGGNLDNFLSILPWDGHTETDTGANKYQLATAADKQSIMPTVTNGKKSVVPFHSSSEFVQFLALRYGENADDSALKSFVSLKSCRVKASVSNLRPINLRVWTCVVDTSLNVIISNGNRTNLRQSNYPTCLPFLKQ